MTDAVLDLAGERVRLLPERALLREGDGTLFVADPHWGKAAAFRAAGVPVPGGTTAAGLARLDAALYRTGARRLVFLGDFLHAREARAPGTLATLAAWRERHARMEVVLVRGNHDRHAGDPPQDLRIVCLDAPVVEAPFVLLHHPAPRPEGYALAGHVHPAVRLAGPGRQREFLPCFWLGARVGVLPSFGDFTGAAEVSPAPGDRVLVVAGEEVVRVAG